jgi:hypothetical protein
MPRFSPKFEHTVTGDVDDMIFPGVRFDDPAFDVTISFELGVKGIPDGLDHSLPVLLGYGGQGVGQVNLFLGLQLAAAPAPSLPQPGTNRDPVMVKWRGKEA